MRPQDFLTPEEFACLKAACKDDRERAIVLTLAGTGMRVNELCNLRVDHLDFEHGYIHVEVAKGCRPRTIVSPKTILETPKFSKWQRGRICVPGSPGWAYRSLGKCNDFLMRSPQKRVFETNARSCRGAGNA
jgi:integrase